MANRYFDGERPAVGPAAGLATAWTGTLATYRERLEGCLLHDALAALWEFVGAANRLVDAEQPWVLAKAAKAGDEEAGRRLEAVLGDLVEACRLVSLAAAPFIPQAAPRALAQLGYEYGYAADGNGGPAILEDLQWGARAAEAGRLGAAEPLFPRLDTEAATPAAG
jgi:methionyl-tRNA synthetase